MRMLNITPKDTQKLRSLLMQQLDKELKTVSTNTQIKMEYNISDLFTLDKDLVKPVLAITAQAWVKLRMLTLNYKHEVAAHGTVTVNNNIYLITDILVYPQKNQAAHVESDDDRYTEWLMQLSDDTINTMRFQYHSHPGTFVTPSGTDLQHQEDMLQNVNDFYIFMIGCEKETEYKIWFFDRKQNVVFEPKDIYLHLDKTGSFLKEAEAMIKHVVAPAYVQPIQYTGAQNWNGYGQQYTEDQDGLRWRTGTAEKTNTPTQKNKPKKPVHSMDRRSKAWRDSMKGKPRDEYMKEQEAKQHESC